VDEGRRARRSLTGLVAGEIAAVIALHRLGGVDGFAIPRHDLVEWLRATPSEDVLLAGVRLAALVAAWWLLASTLVYVAARLARLHGAARALGWATLPCVRRWVDGVAAVSIVAAGALGVAPPAAADPPPTSTPVPPVVVELDYRDRPVPIDQPRVTVRTGRTGDATPSTVPPRDNRPLPAPPPSSVPVVPPTTPAPAAPPALPTPAPPPSVASAPHAVVPGDHLWLIAADHLARISGRQPADLTAADIAPYWWRAVELNRSRLRSGNPNLVYPGEVVDLPPL
jgi:hypothetical protein